MPIPNPSCAVALPRVCKNATETKDATSDATDTAKNTPNAASLQELRAQLRAQLVRNYSGNCETEKQAELRPELRTSESATATDQAAEPRRRHLSELRRLIDQVADCHAFSESDRQEALEIVLSDPDAALMCFRVLAGKATGKPLPDPAMEGRRRRVLAMLAERPDTRYAVVVDNPDTDPVLLTLAIRGQATCEFQIARAKFDPFELLTMLDRHGATLH